VTSILKTLDATRKEKAVEPKKNIEFTKVCASDATSSAAFSRSSSFSFSS